jgi:hypothetical protein
VVCLGELRSVSCFQMIQFSPVQSIGDHQEIKATPMLAESAFSVSH